MLGEHLKVSINAEGDDVSWKPFYFPVGTWCSVINATAGCVQGGKSYNMSSLVYQSYVHIKDGSIVPLQTDVRGTHSTVRKVADIQKNPVDIHIHPKF